MAEGIFNKLHHICIVVHDVEKTVKYYESIGVGPWPEYPPLTDYSSLNVPNLEGFMQAKYRVCNISNMQIQLLEPGPGTPQAKFLAEKGEGVYHLGFEVDDCDAGEAQGVAMGLKVLSTGRRPNGSGFTYFDNADDAGVVLEIRQSPNQ